MRRAGTRAAGAPSHSSLPRNLYLTPTRSIVRKIREFAITNRLEKKLDKERILELYLNVAEWGKGVYGCEAASRQWFSNRAQISPRGRPRSWPGLCLRRSGSILQGKTPAPTIGPRR